MPLRDINAVLGDHHKELLAIPGVVDVYVGQLNDGHTLGLRLMVARRTSKLARKLPRKLEGYRVVAEEAGAIRPMARS